MKVVEIAKLKNGAHQNQNGTFVEIPSGWAVVPANLETPNFPFGEIIVSTVSGLPTVTSWSPLPIPEPEPEVVAESEQDRIIKAKIQANSDRQDFLEDCIAEMAAVVYN